jgi:GNAT superfamily N-acetyltransferase
MSIYESLQKDFIISSDKSELNIVMIYQYLSTESYWAKNIPLAVVQKSIEESFCFGVYKKDNDKTLTQIGFARVITDHATFGYLADVFIVEAYRSRGISKWLMHEIMSHPQLQGFRRWMLATRDAHGLYEQFGFTALTNPERIMQLVTANIYQPDKQL